MKIFSLLSILWGLSIALSNVHCITRVSDVDWKNYKKKFNKKYNELSTLSLTPFNVWFGNYTIVPSEDERRRRIYEANNEKIIQANKDYEAGKTTFTLGHNQFSDWTEEEFASYLDKHKGIMKNEFREDPKVLDVDVPANWKPTQEDFRVQKLSVKDQASCGTCWAFAGIAAIEYHLYYNYEWFYQAPETLSEQNVIDCTYPETRVCTGGYPSFALGYFKENGLQYEKDYPYKRRKARCHQFPFNKNETKLGVGNGYAPDWQSGGTNETKLMYILEDFGPIAIGIAGRPMQLYKGGMLTASKCGNSHVNHAVVLVGYGFHEYYNKWYWIVKNSWGRDWGDDGYFYLEAKSNACNIVKDNFNFVLIKKS